MSFLAKLKNAIAGKAVEKSAEETPLAPVTPSAPVEPPAAAVEAKIPAAPAHLPSPARAPVMRPPPAAPAARPVAPVRQPSPIALHGSPATQADWLGQQIGKVAKSFAQTAQRNGWSVGQPQNIFARVDVAALMLGYKMVSATYQLHNDPPGMEVMRLLRGAITVPLHRAMQALPDKGEGADRIREVDEHLKNAMVEIATVLKSLREKREGAFAPYYAGLTQAFGGETPTEQEQRFALVLKETFARLEQAMAAQAAHDAS